MPFLVTNGRILESKFLQQFIPSMTLYLLIASNLWIATYIIRLFYILWRNFKYNGLGMAWIIPSNEGVSLLTINIPRTWNFRPVQYVYLRISEVSHATTVQSHLFAIFWCDNQQFWLVAQAHSGFTERLYKKAATAREEWKALIEGPYGKESDLRDYGTALLAATGTGIVGQLLYIRQILEDFTNYCTKTRKIVLCWEAEQECR